MITIIQLAFMIPHHFDKAQSSSLDFDRYDIRNPYRTTDIYALSSRHGGCHNKKMPVAPQEPLFL